MVEMVALTGVWKTDASEWSQVVLPGEDFVPRSAERVVPGGDRRQ